MVDKGRIGNISVNQDGENCEVEWKIYFSSVSKKVEAYYNSPFFEIKDDIWYLWIHPNDGLNRGYMDFSLFRRYCDSLPPLRVEFSFSLKTVSGKKDSEKTYVREFSDDFNFHDTHQFLSLSHFKERQSEYLDSGYLSVFCTMKITNPTESKGESYLYCFEGSVISSNTIFTDHFSGKHPRLEKSKNFEI